MPTNSDARLKKELDLPIYFLNLMPLHLATNGTDENFITPGEIVHNSTLRPQQLRAMCRVCSKRLQHYYFSLDICHGSPLETSDEITGEISFSKTFFHVYLYHTTPD